MSEPRDLVHHDRHKSEIVILLSLNIMEGATCKCSDCEWGCRQPLWDTANPFVEQALQYAVAAARVIFIEKGKKDALEKILLRGLHITIVGCNDFYSYRSQIEARGISLTREALAALPSFSPITFNIGDSDGVNTGNCKPEVAKTGLGSSAAMTTSVVAALLHYLGVVELPSSSSGLSEQKIGDSNLDIVHIIAQSAHCVAQGKIGSGFDISAAVYGSQRYVRFSPAVLSSAQLAGNCALDVISDILKQRWDHESSRFSLPPLMSLLLGEPGTGGSSTPSMVGSVKLWQKADPGKALETWARLAGANARLESQLKLLNIFAKDQWDTYKHVIEVCSNCVPEKWMEQVVDGSQELIFKSLLGARDAFLEIRFHMQQMGKAAGVPEAVEWIDQSTSASPTLADDRQAARRRGQRQAARRRGRRQTARRRRRSLASQIEPDSQTRLLDATMRMKGVLLAGVPGAGGFDAVFSIILGAAADAVADAWSAAGVLPLLVKEDSRGIVLEASDPRTAGLPSALSAIQIH
ncbi:phosphomevalonate kinase [Apostasia shenzhenica]|uniref:phosphomevalonate kinase n=1 Tax=Apostasia shenzhenica TaxID=1088818 RepID=A0A2I0AUH0_9ASPA|nr:phosphomevalonate kinase [Apostasia shenzhenica]